MPASQQLMADEALETECSPSKMNYQWRFCDDMRHGELNATEIYVT